MIKLIKNLLSKEKADIIERDLLGHHWTWHWNESTLKQNELDEFKTKNTVDTGQFIHRVYWNDEKQGGQSNFYEGFKKVFDAVNYENAIRIKCNLNLNKTGYKKTSHQPIHRDSPLEDYKSLIYYINDSDGDTILFDNNLKEIKRVKPKKNTALLFDSNILHCGCSPIKSHTRGVINFIFKGNEKNILHR